MDARCNCMLLSSELRKVFFLILAAMILHTEGALISKSSVTLCENSGEEPHSPEGTPCSKKLLITMGLKSGQSGTESLYANIDRVYKEYEGDQELSRLKKPFRIEISKSEVIIGYEVYYRGSANAKPYEETILQQLCYDDWHMDVSTLTCGKYHDGNEYVWDSQGFCCRCSFLDTLQIDQVYSYRGNHTCHLFGGVYSSGHCLRFNDLWYDVYDIGPPFIWYNITIDILEFGGVEEIIEGGRESIQVNWIPVSTLAISPEMPLRRSEDGRVVAEIQGELIGGNFIKDFSTKNLLIPNVIHLPGGSSKPVQYTNGPSDWLIVDKHVIDLSGRTCNKVGTSFTAFRTQENPCHQDEQSCLYNQPLDLWADDEYLRQLDKSGHYMMYNYGEIHPTTSADNYSITMRFRHTDFQNSMVTFHIDASDVTYVYSVANGRIVNAYASNFEALRDNGFVYVEIENTGEITSQFSVSVTRCSRGVHSVSGREVSLDPGEAVELMFQVQTYRALSSDYTCEVELFDADYNLLQSAQVSFTTNGTCFCYGICGCVCSPTEEIVCPDPPEIYINTDVALQVFLVILKSLGPHGIAVIIGGIFIILGCVKLSFGKVLCCRKSKAEALAEELKKQGLVNQNGPLPVICGGECSGAKAAKARYEKRAKRLKKRGKKSAIDKNWRNSSYACTCHTELTDVKFLVILRSVLFFFYCWFLPCILLGKKTVGKFSDTEKVKEKAKRQVVKKALAKGKGYKYIVGEGLDDALGENTWEPEAKEDEEMERLLGDEDQGETHGPTQENDDEEMKIHNNGSHQDVCLVELQKEKRLKETKRKTNRKSKKRSSKKHSKRYQEP